MRFLLTTRSVRNPFRMAFLLFVVSCILASVPYVNAQCEFELVASERRSSDEYGQSVAVSGDVAVVGAAIDPYLDYWNDSVFVFRYDPDGSGEWVQEARLTPSDGESGDFFGRSVSICGDVIVVGSDRNFNEAGRYGSAYIYRYDSGGSEHWIEEAKIFTTDENATYFGHSVSISDDMVVAGAYGSDDNGYRSGSAFIFRNEPYGSETWVEEAKLLASDGEEDDYFGRMVSISGGVAVVGAYGDDDYGVSAGSAYVFRRAPVRLGEWIEEAKLLASDGAMEDYFGDAVSVSGDHVLVGAPNHDGNGYRSGSVYFYRYDRDGSGEWIEEDMIFALDTEAGDYFGTAVAMSGDMAVIGASGDNGDNYNIGSAYTYYYDGSRWVEVSKLTPEDGQQGDYFGVAVSITDEAAVVGALGDYYGYAYAFTVTAGPPVIIIEQPEDAVVAVGDPVCFGVITEGGGGDVIFQWRRDGTDLSDGGTISGSNTDTLCFSRVSVGDENEYDVVITHGCNTKTSDAATLTVVDPNLSVDATCPDGGPIEVSWDHASPFGEILILYADNTDGYRIPGMFVCAGAWLDLGRQALQIAYEGYGGDDGSREIYSSAGPNACGGYLQLLDVDTCTVSNVVEID